jgi:hypothetical protein
MSDTHNVESALAALGGATKTGAGPVESEVVTSGEVVEDLGALVEANEGVPQELLVLALQAALATDESREAGARAKVLKAELEEAMSAAGVTEVTLDDRDPIAFSTTAEKVKTLTALKQRMAEEAVSALAEDADEKAKTAATVKAQAQAKSVWSDFWGRFPTLPKTSLGIPKPREPEPDEA